jgi:hypothetical protein
MILTLKVCLLLDVENTVIYYGQINISGEIYARSGINEEISMQ